MREARDKGADIIVFPEDGIYGFAFFSRKDLLPYLEVIPDPSEGRYTPCIDPGFSDRPVLTFLSCLAQRNEIAIVANMGDKQKCDNSFSNNSPHSGSNISACPPDGWYMYNTNVAFDTDGSLLAKYHKTHLYAGESEIFNTPTPIPHITFNTSFGVTFGTFTCYDILYCDPPLELVNEGVRNFVFPTAWGNFYPFYTSIGFQQAWSWRTGSNLLAANQHFPNKHSFPQDIGFYLTGSGVYSAGEALSTFISGENFLPATGHLLLAKLPKQPPNTPSEFDTLHKNQTDKEKVMANLVRPAASCINNDVSGIDMKSSTYLNYTALEAQLTGIVTASYTNTDGLQLHCSLVYSRVDQSASETYALGAYIGSYTGSSPHDEDLYYGVCSLVKCASSDLTTCGSPVKEYTAETVFEKIELSGGFPDESLVFPVVLLNELELVSPDSVELRDRGVIIKAVGKPLLSASLWARVQPRHQEAYHCSNSNSQRVTIV